MPLLQTSKTDRRRQDRRVQGFLNVYKVPGPTSHDVVARIRKVLPGVRVGHGGTLDPAAEGVLPICLGGATKYFDYLLESRKTYLATVRLGVITDTQDRDGEVVEERPVGEVDAKAFEKLLAEFEGEIDQVPPMYSARRHQGKRLYELARAGVEVERASQKGRVYGIRLLSIEGPEVTFEVECGRGTYVRTLCHDIGEAWGAGGHLARLTRKAVGVFRAEEAVSVEEAEERIARGKLADLLIPVTEGLAFLPAASLLRVPSGGLKRGLWIIEGVFTREIPEGPPGSHVRLVDGSGRTLALARIMPGEPARLQVRKVVNAQAGAANGSRSAD
ncbi:MAG: tRNA pseudouridine(55) synthase TruB [Nitrospinota bacterium]